MPVPKGERGLRSALCRVEGVEVQLTSSW